MIGTENPTIDPVSRDYERLWISARQDLARGQISPDPIPVVGGPRWGISAVVRPNLDLSTRLTTVAEELGPLGGHGQLILGPGELHVTIRTLETYRETVGAGDPAVHLYAQLLRAVVSRVGPPPISFRGLTANHSGVFVQGWPTDDTLTRLRTELQDATVDAGLAVGPEEDTPRVTAHMTVMMFREPPIRPAALVQYIEENRYTDYGTLLPTDCDLVRYRLTNTRLHVISLQNIAF
jgi:2'-5' RNA ligase